MDAYTSSVLDIIDMPKHVCIKGKECTPAVLFSPALCESLLFWHAASLSDRLHGEVTLDTKVVADRNAVSGMRLASINKEPSLFDDGKELIGLASGVLLLAEAGDQIISPSRKHASFDYQEVIFAFREEVFKRYADGEPLNPSDHALNTIFYDNITKPARAQVYQSPTVSSGMRR